MSFTHFNQSGLPRMVDVGHKPDTAREATARGAVAMLPETLALLRQQQEAPPSETNPLKKGNVLAVAQVAGIMAAKSTWQMIPMCHPLPLSGVDMDFSLDEAQRCVRIQATVRTTGKTGVEMEALTAVSVAALTIYDMCKAVDKGMRIESVHLVQKSGGQSGDYVAMESADAMNSS
ncbi:MAG: cyclic pyranopterin monophosphate synthase MoaC [Chloroflexota bacterium]|nr:cyclic pyranopterin monophosphate synthase MoaC [Chloroflexota bacterium]MDE2841351.1 cyclic pyranopterin monophosphate synthase MoaC [Chloroflexota bacterium]MDE2931520.1 cyclic pyranopterin monophosphate synthase MoaC [Chloroflexota bacterium]